MSSELEMAATQIEGWLATMHAADKTARQSHTLFPEPDSQQPLMQSFANKGTGSSAAPIVVGATLAEGGMGVVKFAKQKALGRTVVVKTMRGDFKSSAAEDILREAWATGALEHPNIVPVHDVRVGEDGAPIIVLKRIEGDSWSQLMHNEELLRERFGVRDVLDWNLNVLSQVCQAVRYAHSRHILHRDLKPDNVMIGSFGEVYLVDWGIAMSLSDSVPDCPLPVAADQSSVAGTPCYMSPEMLDGGGLDARTDIYLLGGLLFEILAGRPPHRTSNLSEIMEDIRKSSPDIPKSAPLLLAQIVKKAMAAAAEQRFASVKELADALQHFEQTRGSQLLAQEASSRMAELQELQDSSAPAPQEVHRLFGAIRFGYKAAIDAWSENNEARKRLDQAHLSMAEFELGRGNAIAARGHYEEVEDAPADVGTRIDEAIAKLEKEQAELALFRDDTSWRVGMRTRIVLTIGLGSVWVTLPLLMYFFPDSAPKPNYTNFFISTFGLALLSVSAWFWARESLTRTDLNRKLSGLLLALFPTQLVLFAGAAFMGLAPLHAELLMMFLWLALITAGVATIDSRFWVLAIIHSATFLTAARFPEYRHPLMSLAMTAFVVTCLVIWPRERPARN